MTDGGAKMIRISNMHDAAVKSLRTGNDVALRRKERRNDAIMRTLFSKTLNGTIKGFYLVDNEWFRALHRSPKEDGKIQYSLGYYRNGELIPTSDAQFSNFEEFDKYGYPSGLWEVIE